MPGTPDTESGFFEDAVFRDSKGRVVEAPRLGGTVADAHCHLDMLEAPHLALARCAHNDVQLVVTVVEATQSPHRTYDELAEWLAQAAGLLDAWGTAALLPVVKVVAGAHPHEASKYDKQVQQVIKRCAGHPLTVAIGEIGLDYHYDFSPRDKQLEAFKRQLALANELDLPVVLHIREAHDDALDLLRSEGMPKRGALLHCFTGDWATLEPFLELGCFVTYGGALTFNNGEEIRESALRAPASRLLTETDSPYMAPVPLRGTVCSPEDVVFTAYKLAEVRGVPEDDRPAFFDELFGNALRFYGIDPSMV